MKKKVRIRSKPFLGKMIDFVGKRHATKKTLGIGHLLSSKYRLLNLKG